MWIPWVTAGTSEVRQLPTTEEPTDTATMAAVVGEVIPATISEEATADQTQDAITDAPTAATLTRGSNHILPGKHYPHVFLQEIWFACTSLVMAPGIQEMSQPLCPLTGGMVFLLCFPAGKFCLISK